MIRILDCIIKESNLNQFVCKQKGTGHTTITSQVKDQAARHGLLIKVRDLGITQISVNCIDTEKV